MMGPTLAVTSVAEVEEKISAGDSAEAAAGELLRMRQSQASLVAAASQTSEPGSDVGTVVSKAKRAASSLWLILHAQVSSVIACTFRAEVCCVRMSTVVEAFVYGCC